MSEKEAERKVPRDERIFTTRPSDHAFVMHDLTTFFLDFALTDLEPFDIGGGKMEARGERKVHTRIIMSPGAAKKLLNSLSSAIKVYEDAHGEIK